MPRCCPIACNRCRQQSQSRWHPLHEQSVHLQPYPKVLGQAQSSHQRGLRLGSTDPVRLTQYDGNLHIQQTLQRGSS
ncbi:Uncharacterised protein [Vibrio cholerae]|nr:Uncharacterised protein [Vibrio cholerae]CSI87103.1 Uncharacterised protein [Vibrio cholerae]